MNCIHGRTDPYLCPHCMAPVDRTGELMAEVAAQATLRERARCAAKARSLGLGACGEAVAVAIEGGEEP